MSATPQPAAASVRPETRDPAFVQQARSLRPFYFIVVVWGERYTEFLLNYCIASLLSPNNIPALLNRGNKFLIATTDEDWARMQDRQTFRLLQEYVEPVFIRIPPCPDDVPFCVHMGVGHKLATQMAFESRAYGAIVTPDLMMSDGSVAAMQRHAVNGVAVVLTAALRCGEEPLFEHLKELNIAPTDGKPLIASGRQMVWAAVRSFHSETLRYEWEKPCFHPFPSGVWWRVPDEDGVVVHSLSWAPMLIDYDAVARHDSTVMDNWTIDGDYIYRNFGLSDKVYVVQDSDEIMQVSWAPLSDRPQSLEPTSNKYLNPLYGEWIKGAVFYEALHKSMFFDPLKRKIVALPVFWHAHEIDVAKWHQVEKSARRILAKYGGVRFAEMPAAHHVGTETGARRLMKSQGHFTRLALRSQGYFSRVVLGPQGLVQRIIFGSYRIHARIVGIFAAIAHYIAQIVRFFGYYWTNRGKAYELAKRALRGDADAMERVKRGARYLICLIKGSSPV